MKKVCEIFCLSKKSPERFGCIRQANKRAWHAYVNVRDYTMQLAHNADDFFCQTGQGTVSDDGYRPQEKRAGGIFNTANQPNILLYCKNYSK